MIGAHFPTHQQAYDVVEDLWFYSLEVGHFDDFAISREYNPIPHMYAIENGGNSEAFAWVKGEWLFIVSASSQDLVDAMMEILPY